MKRLSAALMAFLVTAGAAACGGDDDDDAATNGTTPTSTSVTNTSVASASVTSTAVTSTSRPAPATSTTVAADAPLTLRPDGIGDLKLGGPTGAVLTAMRARLGPETEEDRDAGCDSGADRVVQWTDIYLVFSGAEWAGYRVDGPSRPATTDKGVRFGSTVAEVKAAYPDAKVEETTLDWEWTVTAGDSYIGGHLTGPDADDTVDGINAGDFCAFR